MRYERNLIRPVPQREIETTHDELLDAVAALIEDSNAYFRALSKSVRTLKAVSLEVDQWRLGRGLDAEAALGDEPKAA